MDMVKQAGIREWVQSIRERLAPKPKKRKVTAEDVVRHAAKRNHTVQMTYVDRHGKESTRETEPYEIKDGSYWGYSLDGDKPGIRRFKLDKIQSMKETPNTYHPRWAVKLARDYKIAGGQWGEGEKLPEGEERSIRMKYDNAIGGGRYTPKYRNSFIRMKLRGSNPYSNQL